MELKPALPLRSWLWKAFVSTSLIPLIVVEMALLAVYFLTNQSIRDAQGDYLHQSATRELQASVMQNAEIVEGQLEQLSNMTQLFARSVESELAESLPAQSAQLAISPDGVRYSASDTGGAASFYSNITPLDRQDLDKVHRLGSLDFMMKTLKDENPSIASVYFNSADSYNHIYPWFDTLAQYPHDMDITSFNFYYLADAAHNPTRKPVWTDVYLDPAGHGWMMTVAAPVYRGDTLEGVVGIDVTVNTILAQIAKLHVPWAGYLMLVSNKLDIMALPPSAESDFGVPRLQSEMAYNDVQHDYFQPADFNLAAHQPLEPLAAALSKEENGLLPIQLGGRHQLVGWSNISPTDWRLLAVVDESVVMQETQRLAVHYRDIGYLMIGGLVVFYLMFFGFLWFRSRGLSEQLSQPIIGVSNMLREIGQGQWSPQASPSPIKELAAMSDHALAMGSQLALAEANQSAVQQRLELVIDSVTEGLWEYDPATDCFTFKGALRERFGLPGHPLAQPQLLERMPPEDREAFQSFLNAAQHNQAYVAEVEFRLDDLQGERVWLLCRGRTLAWAEDSAVPPVVGTCVNIDQLKQVEQSLREKTHEALAASRAKSRFISGMSHELKTPLNAILGFAQLHRMKSAASDSQPDRDIEEIIHAGEHLRQLVDDLLEWSSLQAEVPSLALKPVDVGSLLHECLNMIRPQVLAHGLEVELRGHGRECQVVGDRRRIKQVLFNLLSNAIKYNRTDGHIVLAVTVDDQRQLARLSVTDNGIGISQELQEQLFLPFQRLGKENSAIKGTGIGLALCRELAELMGGAMGVASELDVGSCFWIDLPLVQQRDLMASDTSSALQ
ncbi:ATP-binding protein [Pseudomonas protegens]|uniref:ATP-binding protein n=1 Tax=Pseudomonas protegens TaxID=380021 RepID=UPI002749AFB1|nr:ATP-binding protein [Pseudomonas protegens]MDP9530573.1 ATP-binding protein [Pseudomonas protegens]